MRVVKEVPHPRFKITIYLWNGKYLVKVEDGHLEQTFKIDQNQIESLEVLENMLTTEFLLKARDRFIEMDEDFREAFKNRYLNYSSNV